MATFPQKMRIWALIMWMLQTLSIDGSVHGLALDCNSTSDEQADVTRWTSLSILTFSRDSHAAAVFNNKIWIVGGVSPSYYTKRLEKTTTRSDVISSPNGITWTEVLEEAPFRRRFGHSLLAFVDSSDSRERLALIGGFSPEPATDIWITKDGATWVESTASVPWRGRGYHCSVAFNNKVWILGGSPLNNEVWSTSSLISGTWKQQKGVPWSARAAHGCATHEVLANVTLGDASREQFLFVMGGWRETTLNDVWRMDTSGEWTQLVSAASWSKRAWHSVVSFDSRTNGDIELGPRLWVIGGGIIGNGVHTMHPYSDVWYTRDGVEWTEASSDASGISTAEWSITSSQSTQTCTGKWGHVVVPFNRTVTRAYYCNDGCMNNANTTSLANQIIPVCDPSTTLPGDSKQLTVLMDGSVTTITYYPDGCGQCTAESRYVNRTTVPALYFIAGNVGAEKAKDVFISDDGMLCEKEGVICSGKGVCTLGGTCLCNEGKTGQFCESDVDYSILDTSSCFPDSAQVTIIESSKSSKSSLDQLEKVITSRKQMAQVRVGDQVFALKPDGTPAFATVYYIPHDSFRHVPVRFVQVVHHLCLNDSTYAPLELTPDHLIYYVLADDGDSTGISECAEYPNVSGLMPMCTIQPPHKLAQKPARELQVNDTILVYDIKSSGLVRATIVQLDEIIRKQGALTLYTSTGNFFVNGVLCSNFGDYYPILPTHPHQRDLVPYMLFILHRIAFAMFPSPTTTAILHHLTDTFVLPFLRIWVV